MGPDRNNSPGEAAENFTPDPGSIRLVREYGSGIIHDTYLVELETPPGSFILQRINTRVFRNPELIMHNLRLVAEHVRRVLADNDCRTGPEWQMVQIIPARDGRDFHIDSGGNFWRALSFIPGTVPLEKVAGPDNAREAGRALGIFHCLTSGIDPELLHDTLPGFHDIELYLDHYDQLLVSLDRGEFSEEEKYCLRFIEQRRKWSLVLEEGLRQGKIRMRVIHGDPKINNVMLDIGTGRAVSIIDLDTVKPGLLHYDIGDCLRSCCNSQGEDMAETAAVSFDLVRCEAALSGYLEAAHASLTVADFDFLYDAVRRIPFELGLRFYTDFLEGDLYFKTSRQGQNLERAMVQFALVESIEKQEQKIRTLIKSFRQQYKKD